MLSKQAIQEFKQIWRSEYSQGLSDEEALEKATKLIGLFKAIYRPIPLVNKYGNHIKKT